MQKITLLLFMVAFSASYPLTASEDSLPAEIHMILTGYWIGHSLDGTKILYEFNDDGSVIWYVDEEEFVQWAPNGLMAKYEIKAGDPFWKIDIFDFDHPELKEVRLYGILDVLSTDKFQIEGSEPPAEIRPEEFTKEAIMFQPASSDERNRITIKVLAENNKGSSRACSDLNRG